MRKPNNEGVGFVVNGSTYERRPGTPDANEGTGSNHSSVNDALKILHALKSSDPKAFVQIARDLAREADAVENGFLGDDHPLAAILKHKPSQESIDSFKEGIAEYRKSLEQIS
jgi:hypothetical protein